MNKQHRVRSFIVEAIQRGEFPIGSQLPGFRTLAEEVGAHPNTVAQAYRDLAEEGIVRSEQGRGTYVLREPPPRVFQAGRKRFRSELEHVAELARDNGIPIEEFLSAAREIARESYRQQPLRLAFVECSPRDTEEIAESIGRLLGLRVSPLLVDDLAREPEHHVGPTDLFITTPYHVDEVIEVITDEAEVISVSVTPTARTLVELSRIDREARIAVVATNERTLERMLHMVQTTARHSPIEGCLLDAADLPAILAAADVVVDSHAGHPSVLDVVPEDRVTTVHFQLEGNSAIFLQERLRDLYPERFGALETVR